MPRQWSLSDEQVRLASTAMSVAFLILVLLRWLTEAPIPDDLFDAVLVLAVLAWIVEARRLARRR